MGKRPKKPKRETTPIHAIEREPNGHFVKGLSANPGGRPADADEIIALARIDSTEAYAKVSLIMRDDGNRQQLAAALAILKLAGVFRGVEAGDGKPSNYPNPFAAVTTDELLRRAGTTTTTLPQ